MSTNITNSEMERMFADAGRSRAWRSDIPNYQRDIVRLLDEVERLSVENDLLRDGDEATPKQVAQKRLARRAQRMVAKSVPISDEALRELDNL